MPYAWKQELYISFKPTANCNAFKTEFATASAMCALHDDPRTEIYQEERIQ